MILTGISKADLGRALREQSLLKSTKLTAPTAALEVMAKCVHEAHCANWELNDQRAWDELPAGAKREHLKEAAWYFGRLAIAGFQVTQVSRPWWKLWP